MSTEVGLRTQYLNWREGLVPNYGITPEWIEINWWQQNGFIERLPIIPRGLKARMRAQAQLRAGLARGPFDGLFIAGHMLHAVQGPLERQAYFITLDVTPKQMHDIGDLYGKTESPWKLYERRKHLDRCRRYQNATALFPWSHWAAQSMIEDYGADPNRVYVVPPGINLEKWSPCYPKRNDGITHILFVGGDFYRKGGDLLLKWAENTSSKDWRLHLVTRDTVRTDHPWIQIYNNLSPNDTELRSLYHQAHIFALPTRGDCYSIASIEAMGMGLPVILAATGGTSDIIQDGHTGYLIEPDNLDPLVERLEYLLAHPEVRSHMGCMAREDAEKRYDLYKNIQTITTIMKSSLN